MIIRKSLQYKMVSIFLMMTVALVGCSHKDKLVEKEIQKNVTYTIEVYNLNPIGSRIGEEGNYEKEDKPLFTDKDIRSVDWNGHKIYFTKAFIDSISIKDKQQLMTSDILHIGGSRLFNTSSMDMFGIYVNDELVVKGYYPPQGLASSFMAIGHVFHEEMDGVIITYSGIDPTSEEDTRDDERLIAAFKGLGLMQEFDDESEIIRSDYKSLEIEKSILQDLLEAKDDEIELAIVKNKEQMDIMESQSNQIKEYEIQIQSLQDAKAILEDKVTQEDVIIQNQIDSLNTQWSEFETGLNNAKTIDDILGLYMPIIDGAYAEAYAIKLYETVEQYGVESFISKLSLIENKGGYIYDITYLLLAYIEIYNDVLSGVDTYVLSINEYLQKDELTDWEKSICYYMLAELSGSK